MKLVPTKIEGCHRVQLRRLGDARGYLSRVFDLQTLRAVDPGFGVAQVNRSLTRPRGTIRGLHFQHPPRAQSKLVLCLQGAIFDVCVDIRPNSPTYRQWIGIELSAANDEGFLVPAGCAHGFQALEDDCLIEYFLSEVYSPDHEDGLRWDDPALAVAWPLPCALTSERDALWPLMAR
jgi:dTDP-4-dehydrorhamnose 3,5-epimerase